LPWGTRVGCDQPQTGLASSGRARAKRDRASLAFALTFAAVELCRPAAVQGQGAITPFPGQAQPGRNVQTPAPPPTPQFDFSIPSPQRGPVPRAVDVIEFDVSDIKVVGATVFPPEAFTPLTAPLIGQKAKLSDIIDIADKIEGMYRQHGYVLTRAFVPPQTVSNGVFQINIVEGFVKAAAVSGGDDMARERVEAYIEPVTKERPATLGTMERGLLLANELPGTTASGLLRPSPTEPGASDLLVNLIGQPWEATLYSDNRGAATTGAVTLGAQLVANTLYYVPGQLMFDLSGTPDFSQRRLFQGRYSRPVGYDGMILTASGVLAHGVPIVAGTNLVSDSYAFGVRLSYPYIVSRPLRVTFEGGITVQAATVTNTGAAAAALAGLVSNVASDDHWREVDFAVTVQQRGLLLDSTTGVTLGVTQGIPAFGAESTKPAAGTEGASTGFTKFTLVAQHDQPISGPLSANFHALAQYTGERLVVGEQTSFGGSGIGRGYDPASLAADIGYGLASELRYDMHFPEYSIDTTQFYGFFDAAQVRPLHDEAVALAPGMINRRSLLSIGFGVRLALLQRMTGGIEFAQQLRGVPNNDNGKTGARILFNAALRF
jgi:hemolysin activation/secretion protein